MLHTSLLQNTVASDDHDFGIELGDQKSRRTPGWTGCKQFNLRCACIPQSLLADGARFAGLCDKIGQGIDLVFKNVLFSGLAFPEFESGNNSFTARIPFGDSAEFKEYVRIRSQAVRSLTKSLC